MTVTQANMFMNTKQFYRSKFLQLALPTQVLVYNLKATQQILNEKSFYSTNNIYIFKTLNC